MKQGKEIKFEENKRCECDICKNHIDFNMPEEIVDAVLNRNLVLFCGAGISTESKLVYPYSLYTEVLNEIEDELDKEIDSSTSFSSLMTLYIKTFHNGRRRLLKKVKNKFDYINSFPELLYNATMFHKEVSSNPYIETIVTTNWDTYFEEYCDCSPIINDADSTLWNVFNRRVFKIHGSINNISSIIATEEDYNNSYNMLSNNLIGDRLKTILTSNTVVFIGFSFGDEDLNRLLDILSKKMGDLRNQFYLVTIDKKWNKINDNRIFPIITDGTYFIHQLNNLLVEKGKLVSKELYDSAENILNLVLLEHNKIFESDNYKEEIKQFPELLFSIAYQDGFIHAFERCVANRRKGEYLIPNYLETKIQSYNFYYNKRLMEKNYNLAFYGLGYLDGLIYLDMLSKGNSLVKPEFFVYGEEYFETKEELFKYILEYRDNEQFEYCKNILQNMDGLEPHFMPWFI